MSTCLERGRASIQKFCLEASGCVIILNSKKKQNLFLHYHWNVWFFFHVTPTDVLGAGGLWRHRLRGSGLFPWFAQQGCSYLGDQQGNPSRAITFSSKQPLLRLPLAAELHRLALQECDLHSHRVSGQSCSGHPCPAFAEHPASTGRRGLDSLVSRLSERQRERRMGTRAEAPKTDSLKGRGL